MAPFTYLWGSITMCIAFLPPVTQCQKAWYSKVSKAKCAEYGNIVLRHEYQIIQNKVNKRTQPAMSCRACDVVYSLWCRVQLYDLLISKATTTGFYLYLSKPVYSLHILLSENTMCLYKFYEVFLRLTTNPNQKSEVSEVPIIMCPESRGWRG